MLVYGDPRQVESTAEKAGRIRAGLVALASDPPGLMRHARLASLLVEAGELAQGLLDEQLQREGAERPGETGKRAGDLCLRLAEALLLSVARGFLGDLGVEEPVSALDALLALPLPPSIEVKVPEGFAFYGLYPETYLLAGACWGEEISAALQPGAALPPVHVVGIRTIGTSLAAAMTAGLRSPVDSATLFSPQRSGSSGGGRGRPGREAGGPVPLPAPRSVDFLTVRPAGHPFDRRLDLPSDTAALLLAPAPAAALYAIADEGPGFSGSSFGSVADWLEDHGVPRRSIAFFPSHRGPLGAQASDRHRERWHSTRRITVDLEELFLFDTASPLCLSRWAEDLTGAETEPIEELSAGDWRALHFASEELWPAVHTQAERRKYLLTSGSGRWLLKFVGLGRYGEEALARAAALEGAGLIPPVAGLRHGFLVERWLAEARPLPAAARQPDRESLLEGVARHLAFVAGRFPAPPGRQGASPARLLEMMEHNASQALSGEEAEPLRAWRERLPELEALVRPVLSDNRLHAWEWLVTPEGRLFKADALDHHRANDLVGPQDPAWDLAGAAVELDLTAGERASLVERFARRAGRRPPTALQLAFYTAAYLAFELGRTTLAAQALDGAEPAEADRLRAAADRYAARLREALDAPLA